MSVSVCESSLCACTCACVCVCVHVRIIKQNTRGHHRLCLSVCLCDIHSKTHTHTHTVFPHRPSSSAIFTSDYTFHLLIFILICSSQTRGGGKTSDRREREIWKERWGRTDGGGRTGLYQISRKGGNLKKREIVSNFSLSNCRCPTHPQAK